MRGNRKPSVGFYMVVMVVAIALPLLAFMTLLLVQLELRERDQLEARTAREAQSLATDVGRRLQEMSTTLRLVASAPELESGDLEAFHNRTQAALRTSPLFVLLVDHDGQQLLNTRVPYGTSLGRTSDLETLEVALESGRTELSDVFFGSTSQQWVFNVIRPLPPELRDVGAALIMTQNADGLSDLMKTEGLPAEWSAAVTDGSGHLIARSDADGTASGQPFTTDFMEQLTGMTGVIEGGFGSDDNIVGYAQLRGWQWKAVVWGPVATAQASILSTWRLLIFGGLALLAIAIGAAWFLGRRLRRSMEGISDMAVRLGEGEIVSPVETRILEADRVALALSEASFDRSEAEERVRFVLRELMHRTKNLLTLIQAMVRQAGRQHRSVSAFQDAIGERLAGLARSIDLLAAERWSGVSMRRVVESHLLTIADTAERVEIGGEDFPLRSEAVQNLGLVLHELATNALKYGALSVPEGRIAITWHEDSGDGEPALVFTWIEIGGPRVSKPRRQGFGSTIIGKHAAAAFRGTIDMDFAPQGFRWTLTAPRASFDWEPRGKETVLEESRENTRSKSMAPGVVAQTIPDGTRTG